MRRHLRIGGCLIGLSALLIGASNGCEAPEDEAPVRASLPFEKRSQKYFAGLDETVTVVKGFGSGHVVRADGSIEFLADVVEQDAAAWISQHGKLTPGVVAYAATVEPNELVPVALVFEPAIDWADYFAAQESDDTEWQAQQKQALHESLAITSASIIEHLTAAGIEQESIHAAAWSPFVHAKIPAGLLESVSLIPEVTRVIPDGTTEAEEHSDDTIANPATFHGTGSLPHGLDGDNYRLSVLEPGPCKIRGSHTMINDSVSYSNSGLSCSSNVQCGPGFCDAGGATGSKCVSGKCLDGHATAVASVLMRFTPQADLHIANGGSIPQGPVCSSQITTSYDFLEDSSTRWVNESYSCANKPGEFTGTDGVVQDYYSRVHNFFITKSAGNSGWASNACQDTWNSVCVGSFDAEKELSCFSSTLNPFYGLGSGTIDREEPDVMALGGQAGCEISEDDWVTIATPTSNTSTDDGQGTSFSAPAVLGMVVLVDQYCRSLGKNWNSVGHRALARLAALTNIDGWPFSTLQDGSNQTTDHNDGAGGLFVNVAHKFCEEPDPLEEGNGTWGVKSENIKTDVDGETSALPNADPEYPDTPPGSDPLDQSLQPSGQTGYRWKYLLDDAVPLTEGMRIRANFSWEACVTSASPSATRTVPTDFDLFLYNKTTQQGLYASQTDDDVNEGFDVIIPEDWEGDYQLLLVWPDGGTGCGGEERTSWAWWIK